MATKSPEKKKEPRLVDTPLSPGEAKAALAVARPAVSLCLCGCGEPTKGRFFPGHDAVLKGRLTVTARLGGEAGKAATEALAVYGWPLAK